jgi:hypothetical protein
MVEEVEAPVVEAAEAVVVAVGEVAAEAVDPSRARTLFQGQTRCSPACATARHAPASKTE